MTQEFCRELPPEAVKHLQGLVQDLSAKELSDPEVKSAAVRFFLGKLRDDPSVQVRVQAVHALLNIKDHTVVPALAAALSDAVVTVRQNAALALGQIGWSAREVAVPALATALSDTEVAVRRDAALALGQIAMNSITLRREREALTAALSHSNPSERQKAAAALERIETSIRAACRRWFRPCATPISRCAGMPLRAWVMLRSWPGWRCQRWVPPCLILIPTCATMPQRPWAGSASRLGRRFLLFSGLCTTARSWCGGS